MQSDHWNPPQTGRYALERLWCQRHHRAALRQTQRTVRGFLGTSLNSCHDRRMSSTNKSEVHPMYSSHACGPSTVSSTDSSRLAEEDGIQPSLALADSRQFSGLVTLATRPLLHI